MKQRRKPKARHFPDPADRYLGKMAILSFCLMLTVGMLGWKAQPVPQQAEPKLAQLAEPEPVLLWKAAPKTIELAALTPGCSVHDWGCVLGESHDH